MVIERALAKMDESTAPVHLGRIVSVSPSWPDVTVTKRPVLGAQMAGSFSHNSDLEIV
jgi:hypothetical protein